MDPPVGRVALCQDESEVTIEIVLGHPNPRAATAAFRAISSQFRSHGAIVLTCGHLQFVIDVTPQAPNQQSGGSNDATDPDRTG